MTDRKKLADLVEQYVEELKRTFPQVHVQVLPGRKVRVKAPSPEMVEGVLDKAVELQTRWYLERGIYIKLSVSGSGPITG